MQRDDVGLAQQVRELHVADAELPGERGIRRDVVGEQTASEPVEDAEHHRADAAGADDAGDLAVQVEADQPVEREVRLADACIRAMQLAVQGQDQRDRVLGHRVRRVLRHADDLQPEGRRRVEVHVVEAGRAQRDQADAAGGEHVERLAIEPVVHERAHRGKAARQRRRVAGKAWFEVAEAVAKALVGDLEGVPVEAMRVEDGDVHHDHPFTRPATSHPLP